MSGSRQTGTSQRAGKTPEDLRQERYEEARRVGVRPGDDLGTPQGQQSGYNMLGHLVGTPK